MRDVWRYQRESPRNHVADALEERADVEGIEEEVNSALMHDLDFFPETFEMKPYEKPNDTCRACGCTLYSDDVRVTRVGQDFCIDCEKKELEADPFDFDDDGDEYTQPPLIDVWTDDKRPTAVRNDRRARRFGH